MLPDLYRSTIPNPYIFTRKLSVKCNSGYRVRQHTCTKCPKNTFSKGGYFTVCTPCQDNEFSDEGASHCTLGKSFGIHMFDEMST